MSNKQVWTATGRRKRSVARVTMVGGTGKITVNGVDVNEYMPFATFVMDLKQPLVATNNEDTFDIVVKATGGGFIGSCCIIGAWVCIFPIVEEAVPISNEF